jgi:aldehyde dehydrogenase family 7 member A1
MFKLPKSLSSGLLPRTIRGCFSSFSKYPFLAELGLKETNHGAYYNGKWQTTNSEHDFHSVNPANEALIARTHTASLKDYENAISAMAPAQQEWAAVPMPIRGDIVRQIGEAFRAKKEPLGRLISLEMGKILSEGLGEVQETIDVCDMACGLSRTIGYLTCKLGDKSSTLSGRTTS